jgi:hypothetical protein
MSIETTNNPDIGNTGHRLKNNPIYHGQISKRQA